MMEPRTPSRSDSPEFEWTAAIHIPKKRSIAVQDMNQNYDMSSKQRYNKIVTAIIDLGVQSNSQRQVQFMGKWHQDKHGVDQWDDTDRKRIFTLDKQRLDLVLRHTHSIAELKSKIGHLSQAQTSIQANRYPDTYDQYLRTLLELHEAISSQATHIIEILRELQLHKDILSQAKDVSVYDESSQTYTKTETPEDEFPPGPTISIRKQDIEAVKGIWHQHRKLYTYIARIRAEVLNCLTDHRDLSINMQNHTLMSISAALGPAPVKDRRALLRRNATIYAIHGEPVEDEDDSSARFRSTWCHVTKRFFDDKLVKNAHIIPAATNEATIIGIFGDPDPTTIVNSPRNFLFLHHTIEQAFDKGRISIVPADIEDGSLKPREFRLWFIDRSLIAERQIYYTESKEKSHTWYDLAKNPKLEFRNDFRPGLRNLYWHCITSLTKAKQAAFPGYVEALAEFGKIWAPVQTSKWISGPVLEGLATAFQMPEITRGDVYLNEADVNTFSVLYTISTLQWQPQQRREDLIDLDEEASADEYDFEYMDPSNFLLSPMGIRSPEHIDLSGSDVSQ